MTSVSNSYGYTQNGNEYKKSNSGKIAGTVIGGGLPLAAAMTKIACIKDEFIKNKFLNAATKKNEQLLKNPDATIFSVVDSCSNFSLKNYFLKNPTKAKWANLIVCGIAAAGVIGYALGNLYDKCVNKERMTDTDGSIINKENKNVSAMEEVE